MGVRPGGVLLIGRPGKGNSALGDRRAYGNPDYAFTSPPLANASSPYHLSRVFTPIGKYNVVACRSHRHGRRDGPSLSLTCHCFCSFILRGARKTACRACPSSSTWGVIIISG
jgi:hypothetical protein